MPGERGVRRTVKEQTVIVDVFDNKSVSAASVIKSTEEQVGEGEILACVPKSGNLYEVTLNENDSVDLICDTGFKIGDRNFKPNAIFSKERLVHNEQGTVSCVDVKSVSDELDLNEDENTTVDNLIVDNEQNKVSNFGGSEDMDLTNEPASHLEDYVVTDSGQIKGSKSLMTNDMIEQEMTDEELAQNMLKMRRRRLGNNPNMSADDIKRLKREPRHKLSSSQK
ncbi:unnamed protein product [Mytilus coruscus]|uniref:Uncharacterized protein n=1 Tax=Mytilus coruscus TaxID=42192 RepID=A0A6J8CW03_MYTCO|nr:unnamed protein product [Mytilus coruscus]